MKILIANDGPTAFYYIRMGLARAFNACGHQVAMWDINSTPAFDMFDAFEPDLFIGQTYNTTKALCTIIKERPHMKVIMKGSDWGELSDSIDSVKYPILKISEGEKQTILNLYEETQKPDYIHIHYPAKYIQGTHGHWIDAGIPAHSSLSAADLFDYMNGVQRPEFLSHITFIGGYWGYKAQTFDKWLLPLCSTNQYRIKIFGNSVWPVPQYCGGIANEYVKDALASALICPNLSEPHSQVYGFDVIERPFKLLANKCFVISDYVEGLYDILPTSMMYAKTPEDFKDMIDHVIKNPECRQEYIQAGYNTVIKEHTYFHRIVEIFQHLNLVIHAQHARDTYLGMINDRS